MAISTEDRITETPRWPQGLQLRRLIHDRGFRFLSDAFEAISASSRPIGRSAFWGIVNGQREPRADTLKAILDGIGASHDDLYAAEPFQVEHAYVAYDGNEVSEDGEDLPPTVIGLIKARNRPEAIEIARQRFGDTLQGTLLLAWATRAPAIDLHAAEAIEAGRQPVVAS